MRPGFMILGAILLVAGMLGMSFGGQLGWASGTTLIHDNGLNQNAYETLSSTNWMCEQRITLDFDATKAEVYNVGTRLKVVDSGTAWIYVYRLTDGSWESLGSRSRSISPQDWHWYYSVVARDQIVYPGDELRIQWVVEDESPDPSGRMQWAFSTTSGTHKCNYNPSINWQLSIRITAYLWEEEAPPPGTPTANFRTEPDYLDVNFISTSTPSEGETLNSWVWDFGDGNDGLGETITHTYAEADNYTVKLTVTQTNGEGDSVAQVITVTSQIFDPSDPLNPAPINPGEATETVDEVTGIEYEPAPMWILWLILILVGIILLYVGVRY